MIFVYCDMGRSPDLDCQYYKHTELEKSATIRETSCVPITGKVIFIVFVFFPFRFQIRELNII